MFTEAGAGALTVIAEAPETLVFAVDVAVTEAAPGATAVTTPAVVTVATAVLLDAHVTVRATPGSASTFATSCSVCPASNVALLGDTVTLRTWFAGAVTFNAAAAFLFASAVDVAMIDDVPAATAVANPVASTVATAALLDDHVTVVAAFPFTCTLAANWNFCPTATDADGGDTVTLTTPAAGWVIFTLSPQAASPASAPTARNDRKSFCILSPFCRNVWCPA
jgi:hypothetical protein